MLLAGVDLSDETLLALVALLRADHYGHVADKLDDALVDDVADVGLTNKDRNAILDVLDDPPAELERLRGVLYTEYAWRVQSGIEQRRTVP
jgi:hypothetical protein